MNANEFVIENGVLVKYTGIGSHVVVPDCVHRIGENAFLGNEMLTSIELPESVTWIDSGAFKNCCKLTNVSLPAKLLNVGVDAFDNTPWLKTGDLVISNTGMLMKYQGTSDTVTIPESVTHFSYHAFDNCTSIKSIEFPASIEEISGWWFDDCRNLTHLQMAPNHPKYRSQGNCIIEGTTVVLGGASVSIPMGITAIGNSAFKGRTNLKKIVIPGGVTHIGHDAFSGCSGLKQIQLPETLREIGKDAFGWDYHRSCEKLEHISIPDSVTHIGEHAFRNCYALQSMYLSKQITSISINWSEWGSGEICACHSLKSLQAPGLNLSEYDSDVKKMLVQGFIDNPDLYDAGKQQEYIKYLNKQRKTWLPKMVLEEKVKQLAVYLQHGGLIPPALRDELIELASAEKKTEVLAWLLDFKDKTANRKQEAKNKERTEEQAFTNPYMAKFLKTEWSWSTLEDGTMRIDKYKGKGKEVDFPPFIGQQPVTAIGGFIFTRKLDEKKLKDLDVFAIRDNYGFRPKLDSCLEPVRIVIPEGVAQIGDWAFQSCYGLKEVSLPSTLTHIGKGAFYSCAYIESLVIPDGVTIIGKYAFAYCSRLQNIVIPKSVTVIEKGAFEDCRSLKSITVPRGSGNRSDWGLPRDTVITRI